MIRNKYNTNKNISHYKKFYFIYSKVLILLKICICVVIYIYIYNWIHVYWIHVYM